MRPPRASSLMRPAPAPAPTTSLPTPPAEPSVNLPVLPTAVARSLSNTGPKSSMRESDQKFLEYVAAKRREDLEAEEARHQARHEEVRGMMLVLGQSMAGVTGALQAHTQSSTVAAARHSEGLVHLAQENVALRAEKAAPAESPEVTRAPKRSRTVGERLQADDGAARSNAAAADVGPVLHRDMLYSATMEPELITEKMKSQPLLDQLQWTLHKAHVSAETPGIFGCFVIKGLYDQASRTAVATQTAGGQVEKINQEKKERLNNIINNKADTYVRQLFWLNGIVPKVLALPAEQATAEAMKGVTLTMEDRAAVTAAIKKKTVMLHYAPSHAIFTPAKARMSHLRDMLGTLATDHGRQSNVEAILRTPAFAGRLTEATKRIAPRYSVANPSPSTPAPPPPASGVPHRS